MKKVKRYIKAYLRKNNPKCKKKFSRVRSHYLTVYVKEKIMR